MEIQSYKNQQILIDGKYLDVIEYDEYNKPKQLQYFNGEILNVISYTKENNMYQLKHNDESIGDFPENFQSYYTEDIINISGEILKLGEIIKSYKENDYLTEEKLGIELLKLYPGKIWIHDKIVPNSNIKFRPDYRCDELKIIVEFDGYLHYNTAKIIFNDLIKDNIYNNMGYKVIRIPYFIQLTSDVIKLLFNIDINYEQKYPQGFISNKAMLPADFNELGIEKFINDLDKFKICINDIYKSLKYKINYHKNYELVINKYLLEKIQYEDKYNII